MSLAFSLSPASDVPIYRQIIQHIQISILKGHLKLGEQLPPVRALAESLVVNPNTVARSYQELIRDGLLESRNGVGVFVAENIRQIFSEAERGRRLDRAVEQLFYEALTLNYSLDEVKAALGTHWKTLSVQLAPWRKK